MCGLARGWLHNPPPAAIQAWCPRSAVGGQRLRQGLTPERGLAHREPLLAGRPLGAPERRGLLPVQGREGDPELVQVGVQSNRGVQSVLPLNAAPQTAGPSAVAPTPVGVGGRGGRPPALAAEMQPGPSPIHAPAAGLGRGEVPAEAGGWLGRHQRALCFPGHVGCWGLCGHTADRRGEGTRTKEAWTLVWPRRREGWGSGRASRGSRSLCGLLKDGEERAGDGAHSLDGHWRASWTRHLGNLAQLERWARPQASWGAHNTLTRPGALWKGNEAGTPANTWH